MTANRGRHLTYYDESKLFTYRGDRILRASSRQPNTYFVCAAPTRTKPNCLGVFRLGKRRPRPSEYTTHGSDVYKSQWGWTMASWRGRRARAYRIRCATLFLKPIFVDYMCGPMLAIGATHRALAHAHAAALAAHPAYVPLEVCDTSSEAEASSESESSSSSDTN